MAKIIFKFENNFEISNDASNFMKIIFNNYRK